MDAVMPTREANGAEVRSVQAPEPNETGGASAVSPPPRITDPQSSGWRRWIRPVVFVIYGLLVAVAVPLISIDVTRAEKGVLFQRILAGVGFLAVILVIPISLWGIINHIICFTRPSLQGYIIRMLWVIPIYELNSWFALRFPVARVYLDAVRQLYQAYVIYNYVYYLLAYFEEVPDFENRLAMKPQIKSPPPCCCHRAIPNKKIIRKCKAGVLNYTVIRIIVTIVTIIAHLLGSYKEGNFSAKSSYLWLTIIITMSQMWAMFCMNLLRRATLDELKILPKSRAQFVGIHLVIFVTNFQSTFLNILAQAGAMKPKPEWGFEDEYAFATMLQDFLVCLEMVAFAMLFFYSFDYRYYDTENAQKMSITHILKYMWTLPHVATSIIKHLKSKGHSYENQLSTDLVQAEQPPAVEDNLPSLPSPTEEEVSINQQSISNQYGTSNTEHINL